MTVVYLDAFLALNFGVNYLLLACAGRLDGEPRCRWRVALAAGLGAGYAALTLLPGWAFLEHPACKAGAAVAMLLVAYGRSEKLLRTGGLFLVLSCAFGGLLLLVSLARETPVMAGGLLGPSLGMRGILIAAALCYGVLSLVLGRQFTHTRTGGELQELTLTRQGRSVKLLALRDTGNTLQDPLTGRPVVVVEGEKLRPLLPELQLQVQQAVRHLRMLPSHDKPVRPLVRSVSSVWHLLPEIYLFRHDVWLRLPGSLLLLCHSCKPHIEPGA